MIIDGEIWVTPSPPPRDPILHWSTRLREGLEHNIRLVIAKSASGLEATGSDYPARHWNPTHVCHGNAG